jgi:purine nucleosidase
MTVIDWWGVTDRRKNALVLRDIDADGFYKFVEERIATL